LESQTLATHCKQTELRVPQYVALDLEFHEGVFDSRRLHLVSEVGTRSYLSVGAPRSQSVPENSETDSSRAFYDSQVGLGFFMNLHFGEFLDGDFKRTLIEVCIAHRHLQGLETHELLHLPEADTGHHEMGSE
jgi:hypothetical protein